MRVVVRRANFDKIAHKIDKMGDYKPEIIYENAGHREVDPRDDDAIAQIKCGTKPANCHRERRCRSRSDSGVSIAGGKIAARGIRFC